MSSWDPNQLKNKIESRQPWNGQYPPSSNQDNQDALQPFQDFKTAMPTNDIFYRPWNPQTDQDFEAGPCGGNCHSYLAMDECEGFTVWNCRHGHWIMPRERVIQNDHDSKSCNGNCQTHPLVNSYVLEMRNLEDQGYSWGDIAEIDLAKARSVETPEQTAQRLKADAAADAAVNAGIVRYSVNKKADKWMKGGQMKFRVPRCCKYQTLFLARTCAGCGSHVPDGQTKCSAKKGFTVCGEELNGCWAHEKNQSCIYVHDDEPQWADAMSGALCYDRERQCFHLRGQEMPQTRNFGGLAGDKRQRDTRERDTRDTRKQHSGPKHHNY